MPSNFDLAPPSKTVDGLLAVPMDIQSLTASLRFDAGTESCDVDATIAFLIGPTGGNPLFDVRQTVAAAWLDGSPIEPSLLSSHDFGGGTDAGLRVIASPLAAGSAHTLRLVYTLGLPAALDSGSGPPTYQWSSGRLTLKFWYTDLRAGRYLDAWLPANLVFDQFQADLEIEIANTAVAHVLISNGDRTDAGPNHWLLSFPPHFSACSGMLRIQPEDDVEGRVGSTLLPGGGMVEIRSFKPAGSPVDLAVREAQIASLLSTHHSAAGPYAHGGRFTVFFEGPGGMEYNGACRTSTGALAHEVFHSWWGRGAQPASQNDAWWDEAWTVYVTGGLLPDAFSFADPPVELFSQNPWVRQTAGGAYDQGSAFFQGLAALLGDGALRALLRQFYESHLERPATTLALESALLAGSGSPTVVDAFHRFVYGFPDPPAVPDLWLRDDPVHTGAEAWEGPFWDSPDLWVRHEDDGLTLHQSPAEGHDNWLYARVRNRGGAARHFMVALNVKAYAGTEFSYPADFLPCITATGGFDLGPGESRVVKAKWPAALVPPAGTHGCLLAAALARSNHPVAGRHVWEDNNLAQKNLTIVDLEPDGWVIIPVLVGSRFTTGNAVLLELVRPQGFTRMAASLLVPAPSPKALSRVRRSVREADLDCGGEPDESRHRLPRGIWTNRSGPVHAQRRLAGGRAAPFAARRCARSRLTSRTGFPVLAGLKLQVPADARPGSTLRLDLVQRDPMGRIAGGIAVQIQVAKRR